MIVINVFLWFVFYSFIGWVYESTICSIAQRKLVNRGFLNGPFCPVYGFGALICIAFLYQKTDNLFHTFFAGIMLTCVVEYITGYLLEKIFNAKWWDYSNRRFNLHGRIFLLGSIVFGVLSAVVVRYIHAHIISALRWWPDWTKASVACILFVILSIDLFYTARHLLNLKSRLEEMQDALNHFIAKYTERAGEIKDAILSRFEESEFYNERIQKIIHPNPFQDIRIARAFPHLHPLKNNTAWQKLKNLLLKK